MDDKYNLYADLHTHTTYSHGKGSIADNVRAAKFRGLECVAITDHGRRHPLVGVKPSKIEVMRKEVDECAEKFGIDVMLGIEANIYGMDGKIDLSDKQISSLDIILAGFHASACPHRFSDIFSLQFNLVSGKLGTTSKAQTARNTKAYINCVKNYPVDIITHPGFWLDLDYKELGKACADYGTHLEISSRHKTPNKQGLEQLLSTSVRFVINSDAHRVENVGVCDWALNLVNELGVEPERIVNCGDNPLELRSRR